MQNLFSSRSGNTPNILHSRHMYQYQMENTKKWGGILFFYLALITALHCRFIDWVNTKVGTLVNTSKSLCNIWQHFSYINMQEIWFSRWLFEGRPRQGKRLPTNGLDWLSYLASISKIHHEISSFFQVFAIPSS